MSALNATGFARASALDPRRAAPGSDSTVQVSRCSTVRKSSTSIGSSAFSGDRTRSTRRGSRSRAPAYCTALGKVLLAHLPEEESRALLLPASVGRQGPNAIADKEALRAELQRVLEEGFATEDEEFAKERIAIAVPVRNEAGTTIAAIDLSSDVSVITVERLAGALHPHLIAAADRISARLGYRRGDEIVAR